MQANREQITHKLKVARGQIDAVLRMVEEDRYCVDISNQILATQALLRGVNQQILEAHIRMCVKDALESGDPDGKIDEALALLEKMAQ